MVAKRDRSREPSYAERVAEKLIEQLQQGTAPWQKPWAPGELRAPYNPTTEKPYRGFNAVWLMAQGQGDPRWMTYKQAAAAGCQVRKGEKGTYIQYVKMRGEEPVTDDNGKPVLDDQGKPKTQMVEYERPRIFGATVFNGSQIDGLPELKPQATKSEWERHELAEAIMQASGIPIHHQPGDRAYYQPGTDSITLPNREQFPTADGYYATALHELGHATGHPSRLNRDLSHPFGSEGYAKEELRAEIASLMLGERMEIGHDPGQHAAYVGSWIKALQEDPREIMRAAADAEKIAAFVMAYQQEHIKMQSQQNAQEPLDEQAVAVLDALKANGWVEGQGTAIATKAFTTVNVKDDALAFLSGGDGYNRTLQFQFTSEGRNVTSTDGVLIPVESTATEAYGLASAAAERAEKSIGASFAVRMASEQAPGPIIEPVNIDEQHYSDKTLRYPKPPENFNEMRDQANKGELRAIRQDQDQRMTADDAQIGERFRALLLKNSQRLDLVGEQAARAFEMFNDSNGEWSEVGRAIRTGTAGAAPERNLDATTTAIILQALSGNERPELLPDVGQAVKTPEAGEGAMTPEEAKLRAIWTAEGVPADRQDEIISQIAAAAAPGARVGPFTIPAAPTAVQHHAPENPMPARTYLAVPFREKDQAKANGAKWDKEQKSWFAPQGADMKALAKWLPENRTTVAPPKKDPKEEFTEVLRANGLVVGQPIMDGEWHRVPVQGHEGGGKKDGAYMARLDGHPNGFFKNHVRDGDEGKATKWVFSGTSEKLSAEDRQDLAAAHAAKMAARDAEREAKFEAASEEITKALKNPDLYRPANADHPYLVKKGLQGDSGNLLQDRRGNLVVPAQDKTGKTTTYQWIGEGGAKGFAKDAKLEGSYHVANPKKDGPIYIGEGWATMDTIRRATDATVVTAFTAGNLSNVAKAIREQHPDRPIVIAGDNDHQREAEGKANVGKRAAEQAAKEVNGYAAIPAFTPDSKGSDWNDFAKEKGTTELQKALNESMVLADRRRLADAQMLGNDGERVEEIVRQNQAKMENQKGANVADMKSAYADLRLKAGKEADRQDKSDEAPKQDQEQEQEQQQTQVRSRGTGRSRTR